MSSTQRFDINFTLQAAGIGLWEVNPVTNQVIWDERCQAFFGLTNVDTLPYEQAIRYIHADDIVRVDQAVKWALNPESDGSYDQTYRTVSDDQQIHWVRFVGKANFTESGTVSRFAGIAQDMTPQMQAQQQLQASEGHFRSLIEEAPVATCLFVGRQLRVDVANAPMLAIWGKGPNQIGRTLIEILPEIADQPFLSILDNVYTSGQTYSAKGGRADLIIDGVPGTYYYDFTYKPLLNADGKVYAILQMAVDVTQQILARQALEEKEAALSNAIELAELGTFSVNVATNALTSSPRVADWFGFEELTADAEAFINGVVEYERNYVRTSLYDTLTPGSDGRYDVVHSVVNAKTGQRRILHALGRIYFDVAGNPLRIEGTAQDITAERELQLVLEQQVLERTRELATANEELAASNEEYTVINQELGKANDLLARSNENLQAFAYVASHDLQEPLRKIQQFGDLLKDHFADSESQEELVYLERMQVAASRMSTLIRDLLSYSRIATERSSRESVPLNQIVDEVLSVLDLTIEETKATVQVDALPTVPGDAVQLRQLFQNLISNALKFRQTDQDTAVAPFIRISSQLVAADAVPEGVKPSQTANQYYCMSVADNGIGFDEKYLNRIFQVFQRLHGKNQYAGTGIGLAICEKIVSNHGGAITASSQPGQGATFYVYLPV